jgi:hypothetical protein
VPSVIYLRIYYCAYLLPKPYYILITNSIQQRRITKCNATYSYAILIYDIGIHYSMVAYIYISTICHITCLMLFVVRNMGLSLQFINCR